LTVLRIVSKSFVFYIDDLLTVADDDRGATGRSEPRLGAWSTRGSGHVSALQSGTVSRGMGRPNTPFRLTKRAGGPRMISTVGRLRNCQR
jgi:hypothetical protein